MLKFLGFVAFLAAYGAWIWACTVSFKKFQSDAVEGHTFWDSQWMTLLGYAAFFVFIFLLSGLWSWRLFVIFFLAAELAVLGTFLVNLYLCTQPAKAYLRAVWLGVELNAQYPKMAKVLIWITVVIYMAYPIAVGISYFLYPWASRAAQTWVVEDTVIYVIFGAYPLTLASVIPLLTSKNLDEGTRQSIFVNQIPMAIPTALFVAVGFWAFRVGASGPDFGVMGLSQSLSLRALILIFLFFAFTILIPFLLGTQRARRQRLDFLKQRSGYFSAVSDILDSPTTGAYVPKLTALSSEISTFRTNLSNSDAALVTKKQIEDGVPMPDEAKLLVEAMQRTGDLDLRFTFVNSLVQLETELNEIAQDLQQRPPATLERVAAKWSRRYKARKAELDKEAETVTAGRALVTVGVSTAATTIVSGILSAFGKAASVVIAQHGIK